MLPERIGSDVCSLANRWILDMHLASMLVELERWANDQWRDEKYGWPGLWIISGHRSDALQADINPDAPNSLHTRCPSMAADLRMGHIDTLLPIAPVWQWLGIHWSLKGGRWGGWFGIKDENHFDLGLEHPPHPPVEGWPTAPDL